MTTDFHIYPQNGTITVVMDQYDPQAEEILLQMGEIFNKVKRSRECDECRNAAKNLPTPPAED